MAERNDYVPVTPGGAFYGAGQYQHSQSQQQTPETQAWPGVVETPYYPGTAKRESISSQDGGGLDASHSSQTPQTPQYGYNPANNYYYYADAPQDSTPVERERPVDDQPISPESAQITSYGINPSGSEAEDLEDLMTKIQEAIDAGFVNGVHQLMNVEFSLGKNASVPLLRPAVGPYAEGGAQDLPAEFKKDYPEIDPEDDETSETNQNEAPQQPSDQQQQEPSNADATQEGEASSKTQLPPPSRRSRKKDEDPLKKCPTATVEEMLNIKSEELTGIVHRAASRGIVQRIAAHDGFKYMFNNVWSSRVDNDGLRFSYICRDSYQNKDRFNHVPTRGGTSTSSLRGEPHRRIKPIWDCKGTIGIKFSSNNGVLVIQYRHAAIHPTHAERKPPARRPRGMGSGRPRGRPRQMGGMKRKRGEDGFVASTPTTAHYNMAFNREPSLFELLQQSAIENAEQQISSQLGDTNSPWWANS